MSRLLIISAVIFGVSQGSLAGLVTNTILDSMTTTTSFPFTSTDLTAIKNDDPEKYHPRPNVLLVRPQEIYEGTGITGQELLIQMMQDQE